MKKIIRVLHIFILILLIALNALSCQAPGKLGPNVGTDNNVVTNDQRNPQERIGAEINQEIIKSEAAADAIVDLRGIDDATVVFWDNRAIVGVMPAGGAISEELREEVINRVKNSNPIIDEINITADKKIFVELDDLQQSLIRGKKINNISKDIEDIANAIRNTK